MARVSIFSLDGCLGYVCSHYTYQTMKANCLMVKVGLHLDFAVCPSWAAFQPVTSPFPVRTESYTGSSSSGIGPGSSRSSRNDQSARSNHRCLSVVWYPGHIYEQSDAGNSILALVRTRKYPVTAGEIYCRTPSVVFESVNKRWSVHNHLRITRYKSN